MEDQADYVMSLEKSLAEAVQRAECFQDRLKLADEQLRRVAGKLSVILAALGVPPHE